MKLGTFQRHVDEMCEQRNITLEQAANHLKHIGIHNVCVGADGIEDQRKEKERLQDVGLTISDVFGHLSFISETNHKDRIECLLEKTAAMGASRLLVTTEAYRAVTDKKLRQDDRQKAAEGLIQTSELAKPYKIGIVIEDYDVNTGPFTYGEDIRYILSQAKQVGFAFDSGNFIHAGEDEVDALKMLSSRVKQVVHYKDRKREPYMPESMAENAHITISGEQYYPCPVGSGIIRFPEIAQILKEIKFDGMILLEHFGAGDQYHYLEESAKYVKKLMNI